MGKGSWHALDNGSWNKNMYVQVMSIERGSLENEQKRVHGTRHNESP